MAIMAFSEDNTLTKHYYTALDFIKTPGSKMWQNSILPELQATSKLDGVQLGYTWPELEPTKDNYVFTDIVNKVNACKAIDKTFSIKIYLKSFAVTANCVPQYLIDEPTAEGGQFKVLSDDPNTPSNGGWHVKMWNTYVRTRLTALANALGTTFSNEVGLEYITLTETAYGTPEISITPEQDAGFYEGRLLFTAALINALPTKTIRNLCNYSRPTLTSFVPNVSALGSSIGWPNSLPDEPGLTYVNAPSGIYTYVNSLDANGTLITPEVQPPDYLYTRIDKQATPGHVPLVPEISGWLSSNMKADIIFWTRSGDTHPITGNKVFTDLLNYLRSL